MEWFGGSPPLCCHSALRWMAAAIRGKSEAPRAALIRIMATGRARPVENRDECRGFTVR